MNNKLHGRTNAPCWQVALLVTALLCPVPLQGQPPQPGTQKVYELQRTRAQEMAQRVRRAFHTAKVPGEVLVDEQSNRLLVRGNQAAQQWAAQLIAVHDQMDPSRVEPAAAQIETTVQGYAVPASQLDAITSELRERYPTSTGVRVAPDTRASQLVVVAPAHIHTEIARYVSQAVGQPGQAQVTEPRRIPGLVDGELSRDAYKLNNITWRDLEEQLRTMWGSELQIVVEPGGRSSEVRVASNPNGAPLMRINRDTDEVTFAGDDKASRPWRQLTANMDRAGTQVDGATQLVPLRRADPSKIRQAVSMIRDAALRMIPGEAVAAVPIEPQKPDHLAARLVSMIFQEEGGQAAAAAQPAQTPQEAPDTPPTEEGEAAAQDEAGLLGDVQIEFIPELGVIILRGNKRDVERVQRIIDEIEKQSDETQPQVEVVTLSHSNSEALGELVTQVYTDVYEPRQGPLSITPLVKPNAILLVGRAENIETTVELITELDQPVAPDTEIRVFRLMNMAALDAEQYINNFYGVAGAAPQAGQAAQGPRGLSTRVNVIADFRSNSLIVQASPRDMNEVAELLKQLDVEKTEATVEVRVFPLKNSLAQDVQAVLTQTFSVSGQAGVPGQPGGQQVNQQGQNEASKTVQMVTIDQQGNRIIESGIVADISVTADPNVNAVLVKAPTRTMGLIAALIEKLDKVPEAESQLKVFQIKNGDATNLAQMLQTLFGQAVTAGSVGVFNQTVGRTFGTTGLQQSSAGESSLIPLTFAVDARTNSIIASGSMGDLNVIEAILLRLDEGDLRQREIRVYRLNNAPAQFVADTLQNILQQQQQLLLQQQQQQFSLISQFEFLDQQVFVVPETISNTLVVSATPEYYEQITDVIEDLDRRPPMIMIQVVVALVRLDDVEELGVELGIQDSLLFDRSVTAEGLLVPGFNFINQALGNAATPESIATREPLAGQGFGSFGVGRSSATEGFPGLVLSAANESVNILIRALARNSRIQVLSRPQIMTMNNIPGSILVGQRVPQVTDFINTGLQTTNAVELIEVGISLGVIPRVTPDGLIIMDIEARNSEISDDGVPIGISAQGIPILSPIYDDITAITTIAARSGQTVVFGGLIDVDRAETFRGVPYLSQIPLLGHLFRFDTTSEERNELIFFMTPHIVTSDEELEMLNQAEAARMSWCLADVIDAHGDPGFGPGRADSWDAGTPVIFPSVDPTAESVLTPGAAEPVPAPQIGPAADPGLPPQPNNRPWIVPPDQVREAEPFILPPDQRQEGRPFIDRPPPTYPPRNVNPPGTTYPPQDSNARGQTPVMVQYPPQPNLYPQGPVLPAQRDPGTYPTWPQQPPPNTNGQPNSSGVVPAQYQQR
jgi:type II secretion system protein D